MHITPPFTPNHDNSYPRWCERWSMLIMREIATPDADGNVNNKFDGIVRELGIARNILSTRLSWLVEDGLATKSLYSSRPNRHEYFLTDSGRDALAVLVMVAEWNKKHGRPR